MLRASVRHGSIRKQTRPAHEEHSRARSRAGCAGEDGALPDRGAGEVFLALLVVAGVLGWLALAVVPLTYDEAYSWTNYIQRGWRVACCLYDAPNNHMFHSMLAASILPRTTVARWPLFLCVPNLLVVLTFCSDGVPRTS